MEVTTPPMSIAEDICFKLSRRRVLARRTGDAGENAATFDPAVYRAWRAAELKKQFDESFAGEPIAGLDVLDLGCGEGELSHLAAALGAKSVTGVDVMAERIASARAREPAKGAVRPVFKVAEDTLRIPLGDRSVDLILCFDVLEHILEIDAVVAEWTRVLRPGGRVFIWWVPWYHPYGHHIEALVPLPWAHVLFSDRTLLGACARVYDMPEFKPRLWDLDDHGKKKPNKWTAMRELPDVNKLTVSRFESILERVGLKIEERRARGFAGGTLARFTHFFTRLPILREFFTAYVTYKLRLP